MAGAGGAGNVLFLSLWASDTGLFIPFVKIHRIVVTICALLHVILKLKLKKYFLSNLPLLLLWSSFLTAFA